MAISEPKVSKNNLNWEREFDFFNWLSMLKFKIQKTPESIVLRG